MSASGVRPAVARDRFTALIEALEAHGCTPRKNGAQYAARCPAHDDRTASLSFSPSTKKPGDALLTCHAGCTYPQVMAALGLENGAHANPVSGLEDAERIEHVYRDAEGRLVARKVRLVRGGMTARHANGSGKAIWWEYPHGGAWYSPGKLPAGVSREAPRVLYRLPELLAAIGEGRTVYVVEGERCADALAFLGLTATTSPAGASKGAPKWTPEFSKQLRGAVAVRFLADDDAPGVAHAEAAASLTAAAGIPDVRVLRFEGQRRPDGSTGGGDVADWVRERRGRPADELRAELEQLAEAAQPWTPDDDPNARTHHSTWRPVLTLEGNAPNLTDLGNAERLAARHADSLRYCQPWGYWLVWDGRRWARDRLGEAFRLAKETVRGIYAEAAGAPDDVARRAIAQHALRSESQRRIVGMLELAKSDPRIAVVPEQFDADATRFLLNVLNGTLDLLAGEVRPHDPAQLITRIAPVEYRPGARSERWERFLDKVLPDEDVRTYVQRFFGYSLTGDTREQVFALFHGTGANGKSTALEALKSMLGDYAHKAEFSTFLQSKSDSGRKGGARPDVLQLAGKRLVLAIESAEGRALDVATVKELTGGDTVTARGLYQNELTPFRPQAKLALAANHRPRILDSTEAIWRRIHAVPFTVTIPEGQRDGTLPDKLREPDELAGILWWAVAGCQAWMAMGGLKPPSAVVAASLEYRGSEDFLAPFLEARCVRDPGARSTAAALFRAFETWCREVEEEPASKTAFGRALEEHGFKQVREAGKGTRLWAGLRLADMYDTACGGTPNSL